ncbi:phage tail assembly protein [Paenibacillus sp. GbtcB18]|uniref:phage tail assembly protein n=1 Tax=Paenibacillus sp. GbtcB18 TaxID=2824763 RepID=UPI001C3009A9|nr:phage tail assembly protein [Paenibacillus sp. GbtcB18]
METKKQGINEAADDRVYKLSRPFTFEGQEYTKIILDFDKLTGKDLLSCEQQLKSIIGPQEFLPVKGVDSRYQAIVASRASGLPYEFFEELPASDFSKVTQRAQNFLFG